MKYPSLFPFAMALALSGSLWILAPLVAQETSAPSEGKISAPPQPEISAELMRSFLHLQEQIHATQLSVERTRLESEVAAARGSEALNNRLKTLEDALAAANKENTAVILKSNQQIQESNNKLILLTVLIALIVFAALGWTAWLQWRTVSRLTAYPAAAGFSALLSQGYTPLAPGSSDSPPGGLRLMDALKRLEHRIAEMEGSEHPAESLRSNPIPLPPTPSSSPEAQAQTGGELADLIQEGEELLTREDAEKAIEHFNSILAKHPGNPEVLLHKGTALERLRRDQEAIECYDLAIRADKNLTMAYLHKGGLFNRMERFSEAMECYEQALRVQEGRQST